MKKILIALTIAFIVTSAGFLLFFIYTTAFSKPNALKLTMPEKQGISEETLSKIKPENSLTVILGKNNRIFWYQKASNDLTVNDLNETDYTPEGICKVILDNRKKAVDAKEFTVIIKQTEEATWKNTVDILDEMAITKSEKYVIKDPTQKEFEIYKQKMGN
jgi:hypothetical protein